MSFDTALPKIGKLFARAGFVIPRWNGGQRSGALALQIRREQKLLNLNVNIFRGLC
jgi:hypothetical protein